MSDTTVRDKILPPRRKTHEVRIGCVIIGGSRPVAVQSMTGVSTMDTAACVKQIAAIRGAGGLIVRLTAQGPREAENLRCIAERVRAGGMDDVALVADIHFRPEAALIAARYVDKVRINPGNFGEPGGAGFRELVELCRSRGVAIRIGVNHGSLSPQIVEKWGDTPEGMVESALEFLRVCRRLDFDQVVVSMKSSNVRVMVAAYRLLVTRMDGEGMTYPLHLGVTEAGDGMQGRIKSSVGIGTLLAEGIGDTIRVSLTEPPENEIPVGLLLADYFDRGKWSEDRLDDCRTGYTGIPSRRHCMKVGNIGGGGIPLLCHELDKVALGGIEDKKVALFTMPVTGDSPSGYLWERQIRRSAGNRPVVIAREYAESDPESFFVKAAADFGMPLLDGLVDAVHLSNRTPLYVSAGDLSDPVSADEVALAIMQATRVRISHTEYIACPGCGRTLYDLQGTLARIRQRTNHLTGLKIGVMGCIVNGPGEMADADYGYVGEGPGRVSLYKGRKLIKRAVPERHAVEELVALIKQFGDWKDP